MSTDKDEFTAKIRGMLGGHVRRVAERVYEIVMESITYRQESITYGQRTRRVLVLPESLMGDS